MGDSVIDKNTILFGLIGVSALGDKIVPKINKAFAEKEINANIVPMNIQAKDFTFTLAGLRKAQLKGVLLKEEYHEKGADEVDFIKSENGLVNLVIVKNGLLEGFYIEESDDSLISKIIERVDI